MLDRFNQPTPQPPAPQPSRFDLDLPDEEYLTGRQVKGILQQFANQPAPVDMIGRQQAAQAMLAALQIQRADDFKRWGPEISQELAKLDQMHWTLDNLKIVVDIVKSRHINELAAEKAQQLVNESHPTIRSGTGGSAGGPLAQPISLDAEGVPKAWATAAKAAGITEAEIREWCAMTGDTPEKFMADLVKFGKGTVIRG